MKIKLGRREGKTTRAIVIANETGAYLLVKDRKRALECGKLTARFPVTFAEFFDSKMKGSFIRNIVIDDFDEFLEEILRQYFSGLIIEAITFTETPEEIIQRFLKQ